MRKIYLTALFWFCLMQNQNTLFAQAAPDEKMLSGTAVGSGLGQISSPNLFDGTTNVNIPIYQFNKEGGEYGVSFSYHTKGVKVDEISGQIGLHWNLNTLPSITRVMKDLPDEINFRTDSFLQKWQTTNDFDSVANREMYLKGKLASYLETPAQLAASNAVHDGESDEFIVSLGGSSFSFYIDKNFNVFTVPKRNVRVQMKVNGIALTHFEEVYFSLFHVSYNLNFDLEVRDEDGTVYSFIPEMTEAYTPQFRDWMVTDNAAGDIYYIVKWRIQKIIFADGQEIDYAYENLESSMSLNGSTYEYLNYFVEESTTSTPQFRGANYKLRNVNYYPLSRINYPNGTQVSFSYDPQTGNEFGASMIDEVQVGNGGNCLRYRLESDSVNQRRFLKRITMASCDGSVVEPYYSFEYDTTKLSDRLGAGQDLYGYSNSDTAGKPYGTSGNQISIPIHLDANGVPSTYGAERGFQPEKAMAGILNKVTNAYGGYIRFFYGTDAMLQDVYTSPIYTSGFVGSIDIDGLMVDSVKMYDPYYGNAAISTTRYSYSGGKLFLLGGFFHYPEEIDSATNVWKKSTYQSMFLTAHPLVNGSNHGFSTVTVSEHDATGALLSKKTVEFSNVTDALSTSRYYTVPGAKGIYDYPYTDKQYLKDWEVGLPLKISQYDQNGHIVMETINEYEFGAPDLSAASTVNNVKTIKVNTGTVWDEDANELLHKKVFSDAYFPYRGSAPLKSSISRKYYTDGLFIADTVTYKYDGHDNPYQTITSDSKYGKTMTNTVYNYNVDGFITGSGALYDDPNSPLYKMTVDGIEKVVGIERWKLVAGSNGGDNNDKLVDAFITRFNYENGRLRTGGLFNLRGANPTRYQYRSNGQPAPILPPFRQTKTVYQGQIPEPFQLTSEVTLFDAKNNPIESKMLGLELYKSMIWDTLSGQKMAEANCRQADLAYASFEETVTPVNGLIVQGNFNYSASSVMSASAVTGKRSYWLTSDQGSTVGRLTGTHHLQAGKEYIFSFWLVGAAALPSLYIGTVNLPLGEAVYQSGNTKNYQVRFTPQTGGVLKLEARPGYPLALDEARLYPSDAAMSSQTYEPLFGLSSSTDASGRVTYYEYDKLGRLGTVRDMEGNIISHTEYHINQ